MVRGLIFGGYEILMEPKDLSTVVPVASFSKEVERDCGVNVDLCFQCKKCSSGCPVN